jgi:hypothetical protein
MDLIRKFRILDEGLRYRIVEINAHGYVCRPAVRSLAPMFGLGGGNR